MGSRRSSAGSLAELLEAGRRTWPEVRVDPTRLAQALDGLTAADLAKLHASDLFLAVACAAQDAAALRAFDALCAEEVERVCRRGRADAAVADELRQRVRERLLVAGDRASPRLAAYRGQGPLGAFVSASATRLLHNLRRGGDPEGADGEALDRLADEALPADLALLRRRYQPLLRRALRAALGELTARERSALKLHVGEGLSAEKLGAVFHFSRAHMARVLAQARSKVLEATRRALAESAGVEGGELDSLVRALRSELDLSLRELFRSPSKP